MIDNDLALCCAVPCRVVPCRAVLCRAMICHVTDLMLLHMQVQCAATPLDGSIRRPAQGVRAATGGGAQDSAGHQHGRDGHHHRRHRVRHQQRAPEGEVIRPLHLCVNTTGTIIPGVSEYGSYTFAPDINYGLNA